MDKENLMESEVGTVRTLGAIGVEMMGIDLTRQNDTEQDAAIVDAFNEFAVLLFRDQSLCPQAQITLTRLFGKVHPHPLRSHRGPAAYPEMSVVEHGPGLRTRRNDIWHSDASFAKHPPTATVLHAIEVPQARGDTMICNMVRAYDQLSCGLKSALTGLLCLHNAASENEQVRRQKQLEQPIPGPAAVSHPLVLTHRPSGQESLYINPHYVTQIHGFTASESRPLLDYLYQSALRPENIYRHRWQKGDVLIWDNRRTMHYAIRDYDDSTVRIMHRTSAC